MHTEGKLRGELSVEADLLRLGSKEGNQSGACMLAVEE